MAYKQHFDSASLGSTSGYVEYTISPDVGSVIAVGEEVTITGIVYSAGHATTSINVNLRPNASIGGTIYPIASLTKSISKGSKANFTIKFTIPDERFTYSGRVTDPLYISFTLNASSGYSLTTPSDSEYITILKTRLNPFFSEANFVRCNSSGLDSDEGTYIKISCLKMGLASGLTYSDISSCYLTYTGSNAEVELNKYMLVNVGYSETVPMVLGAQIFSTGQSYTFTIHISDDYNAYSIKVDTVPRAFANMHLSGATTGGVAFGMFSSAEENVPKFETAYPAYFYGGIAYVDHIEGIAMDFSMSEQATGRKWVDSRIIYQKTYIGSTIVYGEKVTIANMPTDFHAIIKIEGVLYSGDKSRWFNIPHVASDGSGYYCSCVVESSNGSVDLNVGPSLTGTKNYYITVYYTKT